MSDESLLPHILDLATLDADRMPQDARKMAQLSLFDWMVVSLAGADQPLGKKPIKSSVNYQVICKHPMGHTLKYTVDQENWNNLYNSRNSIWRFSDIEGNYIKISGPCFTEKNMKSDK